VLEFIDERLLEGARVGADNPVQREYYRSMLSLSQALKSGRLSEFAAQEEARGIGPIDRTEFGALLKNAATKAPQSKGQTSHSSSGDGSSETKIPRGRRPSASR
jgi:hypothetical protein